MSTQGSIKKDATTGLWGFVVDVPTGDGKRKQVRRRGFALKSEASDALALVLVQMKSGTFVRPTKTLLGDYLRAWVDTLPGVGRRPSTVDSYRRNIERNVVPYIGGIELHALTPLDLDGLYAKLIARGLSMRTVRYVHTIVGKALSDAERKGVLGRNVARLASPPSSSSAKAPEMTVWTPAELRAFLEAHAGHHHLPMLRLASMTGMRRAELCGLRWTDVDLDAATVTVRQSITAVDGVAVVGDVKTKRSRRVIDIDATTVDVLRAWKAAQNRDRLKMGEGWANTGLVFTMGTGQGWHPDTISQAFDRLVAASDLQRIRLHDLRHTHASHLLAAGVNVKVVSERLGHASVAFTLDVYAHVMPGQQAHAAAAAAALVDGIG